MVSSIPPLLLPSPSSSSFPSFLYSYSLPTGKNSILRMLPKLTRTRPPRVLIMATSSQNGDVPLTTTSTHKLTKLVTFLGKGGSGKTTSAIFAAQVLVEELGVLPGMDSIFSALELERLVGFYGNIAQRNQLKYKFDVIVYDGISTQETIRMIGATSKARLYLKYLRNFAERTDLGRLAGPSLLRLVNEAISLSNSDSHLNGKMSAEIWDNLEQTLERGSSLFGDPSRFGCYLVMDPNSPTSMASALRYWGCAIQAGAQVSGAFGIASPNSCEESMETVTKKFSSLPYSLIPPLALGQSPDWNEIMLNEIGEGAKELLSAQTRDKIPLVPSVQFDPANKSVTLLMPGFDKSEIKLYQFRGGSELLVEAGDQKRVIRLPSQIQGKVGSAKFTERSLVITMQ
ncbi:hypothetical protein U1Q18_002410 [Sarracenia purpurea var. burkii]